MHGPDCTVGLSQARGSSGTPPEEHDGNGLPQDEELAGDGPAPDVFEIVVHLPADVVQILIVALMDLGPPGNPGAHRLTLRITRHEIPELPEDPGLLRARTHQVHVALQDVEELGKLVQTMTAEHGAQGSDAVLMGAGFSTLYGQTEHCPVITQHHLDDRIDDICNTAGQPVAQTEVSIRSVDDNLAVAIGEVGEICARGPCVMLEYNDNPKATSETVDAGGWLHTGDLGRMDARGYVTVTGRVKEMIIRGGENHFPAEIENCLLEHASVAEVAVVGLPDPKWGEVIGAFIRGTGPLDRSALHAHCRANMSPQKTPNVWVQVESFPLTGSGKIQKFVLRDRFVAGEFTQL